MISVGASNMFQARPQNRAAMAKALMRVEQFLSVEQIEAHMQMIERADSCKTMILPCVRQCFYPGERAFKRLRQRQQGSPMLGFVQADAGIGAKLEAPLGIMP